MKEVMTQDGSKTFFSEEYSETYHSVTGAVEEAFKKYSEASNIDELARAGKIRILDVCFGLGYNTAAALDRIWSANPDCQVEVVGLEKDQDIPARIIGLNPQILNYHLIKKAVQNHYIYSEPKLTLKIILGDACAEIRKLAPEFDLIFHDPFSPKNNPELWTEEFFSQERRVISKQGTLTTYSCARMVRENLKLAGFDALDGPCVGRRAPSTIAKPI
jgi:tRNA U34 5-methylaminomethyl-2-thiouridine-forming methyltransferase MnmC